jgi:organic radical activating enzyme
MHDLDELCAGLHAAGMRVHLETSGSHPFSGEFDWVCLSPKKRRPPLDDAWALADELKVVIETPADFEWAERCAERVAERCAEGASERYGEMAVAQRGEECAAKTRPGATLFLQPEWSRRGEVLPLIVAYVKRNPRWRLSVQAHKYIDIP